MRVRRRRGSCLNRDLRDLKDLRIILPSSPYLCIPCVSLRSPRPLTLVRRGRPAFPLRASPCHSNAPYCHSGAQRGISPPSRSVRGLGGCIPNPGSDSGDVLKV